MGENTGYVFTHDWKRKKDAETTLLRITDDQTVCGKNFAPATFTAFEVADYNGDGLRDLGVTVKAGRYPCGRGLSTIAVRFLFDGKSFHVSTDTAAAKRKLDALMRQ
jgi:hypothetical protein